MFQPIVPMPPVWQAGGFCSGPMTSSSPTFTSDRALKRDTEYFRENIGRVETAEDLVSDRRLMSVALGAFGLQDDIDNRYFIRKVLEEGTTNKKTLANRFADKRYKELSEAFGFGPGKFLKVGTTDFVDDIVHASRPTASKSPPGAA